jgi:hypothetical protein
MFEVDQNRVGETWTVVLKRDGVRFFRGERVTRAPSGSFEVRRVISNQSGPCGRKGDEPADRRALPRLRDFLERDSQVRRGS